MSKEKQTAVEWLFKELNRIRIEDESGNIGTLSFFIQQDEALKQAKEMEKQQMRECYENVFFTDSGSELKFEQYYNETFKKD
jgi:hypothetical protein